MNIPAMLAATLVQNKPRGNQLKKVTVRRAEAVDATVLRNMLELYLHDLSEFWPYELNEHGCYGYSSLDYYWREAQYAAYLFLVNGCLAGFALVNNDVCFSTNERWMAQFFIVKRYRLNGIATEAARQIFDLMPGKWEVGQIPLNRGAQIFWHKTIAHYTNGNFSEEILDNDIWRGMLHQFNNSHITIKV